MPTTGPRLFGEALCGEYPLGNSGNDAGGGAGGGGGGGGGGGSGGAT